MPSNLRSHSRDPHPILQASAAAGPIVFPGRHSVTEEKCLRFASSLPINVQPAFADVVSRRETGATIAAEEAAEKEDDSYNWSSQNPRSSNASLDEKIKFILSRASGFDSGWLQDEQLEGVLDDFLFKTAHALKSSDGRKGQEGGNLSVVAARLDTRNAFVSATKAQLSPLEHDGQLPVSRMQFFGCGQVGHELQWTETADGREVPSALCILFQSPTSFVHDLGACARLDLRTGDSMIAYFDRNEDRVNTMVDRIVCQDKQTGDSRYSTRRDHLWQWLAELLASYGKGSDHWRILLERQVRLMEGETGSRAHAFETGSGMEHSFGRLTMAMPNANVSLVGLERVVQWQEELWGFLREMILLADSLAPEVGGKMMSRREKDGMLGRISDAQRECAAKRSQMEAVQKRMQVQISVLYSLVSQRDNRVNIELAEDSRKIAQAAKKDSRIMKVIAALTLIFLPATLISSVFSTGIFNVGFVEVDKPRVSELWWIFVVASVVLTAVVMFLGFMFLREDIELELPRFKEKRK